ncbi:MAG: UDP-N-acetylmuramate--L-alanine ligase [Planctomycetes bacterium]|nr:UDP-N-acetylmuramate--L-alanine ligase [Planctomycetota bacterium]
MAGLARVLLQQGWRVSGSDLSPNAASERLIDELGAEIAYLHRPENVTPEVEVLVRTAAVGDGHPEVAAARAQGVPVLTYAEMIGRLMGARRGVAVAGTHGKSTTTAMVVSIMEAAGLAPSFIVGANLLDFDHQSARAASGDFFVAEACEYNRSFHRLSPEAAIITNVEPDHLDCYGTPAAYQEAFDEFARRMPAEGLLLVNSDDPGAREAARAARCRVFGATVADAPDAHYAATDLMAREGRWSFQVRRAGERLGEVCLRVPGRHNVSNAVLAAGLALSLGAPAEAVCRALTAFRGAARRLEVIGEARGATVVDDYAHHPTKVRASLAAVRGMWPERRVVCVYQPHQHSRTRLLLADFGPAFEDADEVVVTDIYAARDGERDRREVNAGHLANEVRRHHPACRHVARQAVNDLLTAMLRGGGGEVVVFMGAGDVTDLAREFVRDASQRLRAESAGDGGASRGHDRGGESDGDAEQMARVA